VSKIGGQMRQPGLDVCPLRIPVMQGVHCKTVPQIMKTRRALMTIQQVSA
jgi:hypothetical protein